MDSNPSPLCRLVTWTQIFASLNHRRKMKAEPNWLIPQKLTEGLELFIVMLNHHILARRHSNSLYRFFRLSIPSRASSEANSTRCSTQAAGSTSSYAISLCSRRRPPKIFSIIFSAKPLLCMWWVLCRQSLLNFELPVFKQKPLSVEAAFCRLASFCVSVFRVCTFILCTLLCLSCYRTCLLVELVLQM